MKNIKIKTMGFLGVCVIGITVMVVLTGCEPTDWDIILAGPNPVSNVSVDAANAILDVDNNVSFKVSYTAPAYHEVSLYPDANYDVLITYRKSSEAPSPPEYESTNFDMINPDSENKDREIEITIPETDLENGGEYIITVYTADGEGQLSEGVDSDPFTLSW